MGTMETPAIIALVYLAIGAVFFAHPAMPATPDDFHWRRQINVFRCSLVDVLIWPMTLWQLVSDRR
jgi:hypothetical protein